MDGDAHQRRREAPSAVLRTERLREERPWAPSAWELLRGGRWGLAPGAAAGGLLLVVAGVVVLLVLSAGGGAGATPTPTPGVAVPSRTVAAASAGGAPGAAVPPAAGRSGAAAPDVAPVVVDVAGQVAQPGLVRLPAGARVDDALTAAGGALATADLRRVNRARLLADGEQLVVPAPGEEAPRSGAAADGSATGAPGAGRPPAAGATGPLDLNTATAAELDALPGMGPVLAERVLQRREEHGPYASVEELAEVTGIGPTILARLAPLLVVRSP